MISYLLIAIGTVGLLMSLCPNLFVHETVLGIDLGTTYSVACVCVAGNVSVVFDPTTGSPLLPSVVSFFSKSADPLPDQLSWENKRYVVGQQARNRRHLHPQDTIFDAKRLIGRKFGDPVVTEEAKFLPFQLRNNTDGRVAMDLSFENEFVTPEIVGGAILKYLKHTAEKAQGWARYYLGFRFHTATVTVPVLFHGGQRRATEIAGKFAGFKMVRVIEEPIAAALAYRLDTKGSRSVLVFDFGGGTLDVALLNLTPKTRGFLVRATAGDAHLGGEDFDRNTVDLLTKKLKQHQEQQQQQQREQQREQEQEQEQQQQGEHTAGTPLWRAAQEIKHSLQNTNPHTNQRTKTATVSLAVEKTAEKTAQNNQHGLVDITISAEEFDAANEDLFQRAMIPIRLVLEEANMEIQNVEDVVLVGGSSRLFRVRELLKEMFKTQDIHYEIDPDLAIAVGAARAYGC